MKQISLVDCKTVNVFSSFSVNKLNERLWGSKSVVCLLENQHFNRPQGLLTGCPRSFGIVQQQKKEKRKYLVIEVLRDFFLSKVLASSERS